MAAKRRGRVYKASRGTLIPAPGKSSLSAATWIAIGSVGFGIGWTLIRHLAGVKRKDVG